MKSPESPRSARFWRAASLLPALAACTLNAAEPVSASESAPVAPLEKTVVVASRREEKVSEVSPSVSVVTRDEVETRQLGTLAEALTYSPGVIVATSGAPGGNQSVFTRGTNSNMTAVLLDGRRVSPGFSNSSEIERFSLAGVNSVEFMRGASSTLYGANALGGVIDMRTKDTLSVRRNSGELTAEFGSFGYSNVGVSVAGNTDTAGEKALFKGLGASASFTRTETDNDRRNNDFSRDNLLQKFEYRISDTLTAEWLNQYYETRAGAPGSVAFPSATQRLDRTGWMTSPGLKFDNHDGVRASTFYAYSFARLDSYGAAFGVPTRSEIDAQEFTNQLEIDLSRFVTLTLGYTYYATAFDRENRTTGAELPGSPHWESHSPWARLELTSKDKAAKIGAGVRYQWFDAFSDALTGEAFGSYRFVETGTLLSAKVASAYAAPAAANYQKPPLNELKPEESVSWEVGARQQLLTKVSPTEVGVVYFENRMDNIISSRNVALPPAPGDYRAFNALEARARGLELFGETRPAKQLLFFANATVQDARYTEDQPAFAIANGDRLLRRPEFMATAGVEVMPTEVVTLGFSATGVKGREDFGHVDQDSYIVSRIYGEWRFTRNARLFARVENLFDKTYEPAGAGYPALSRAVYVGLTVGF